MKLLKGSCPSGVNVFENWVCFPIPWHSCTLSQCFIIYIVVYYCFQNQQGPPWVKEIRCQHVRVNILFYKLSFIVFKHTLKNFKLLLSTICDHEFILFRPCWKITEDIPIWQFLLVVNLIVNLSLESRHI